MKYLITTTKQGNTSLACVNDMVVSAYGITPGDAVTATQEFEATPDEFADLQVKAATHDLTFDTKTRKVTAVPRENKLNVTQA